MTQHNQDIFRLIKAKRVELSNLKLAEAAHFMNEKYMELLTIYSLLDVDSEPLDEIEFVRYNVIKDVE